MPKKWLLTALVSARCFGADVDASQLVEFSLEDLMNLDIEVTSSAKREQRSYDIPSAVFVITADDLHRSGVTTIPDALRMVPGVQVGLINNNEWAIGVRGLGGRFSRYLQVLIDGRSVYDTLFSGINWDEQNLALEDIERIEVIRGPGSSVWGANAVNGVINIVTRLASAEDGQRLTVGGGNYHNTLASGQASYAVGESTEFRISANHLQRDGLESINRELEEGHASSERVSFAMTHRQDGDEWLLNADLFQHHNDTYWVDTTAYGIATSGGTASFQADEDKVGYAIQSRYSHAIDDRQTARIRFSIDDINRDSRVFTWNNRNVDIDIEYVAALGDHYLTLGSNNRFNSNEVKQTSRSQFLVDPQKDNTRVNSLFIHDTLSLNDEWKVDIGLRYEKQSEAGENVQGTLRSMWLINDRQRLWAAISKADNTPSRITYSETMGVFAAIPANPPTVPLPVQVILASNGHTLDNTELIAYETGYRHTFSDRLSIDAVAFYNDYRNMLSVSQSIPPAVLMDPMSGYPYIQAQVELADDIKIHSYGAEVTINWQLHDQWLLQYNGSYINFKDETLVSGGEFASAFPAYNMVSDVPTHQHSLRLLGDLNDHWSVSFWLRHVGDLNLVQIDSYTVVDAQLSYQPSRNTTVSLIAQNLGNGDYEQAARDAYYVDTFEVEPSLHAKVSWSF